MQHSHQSIIRLAVLGGALTVCFDGQAAVIDMGFLLPTPGSIGYAGGSAPLTGGNIQIDNIIGKDTSLHNNATSTCVSCVVSFMSGSFSSYNPATKTWDFSGGGAISVVGGVDFGDNTSINDIAAGTTLLTGIFQRAAVIKLDTGFFDFRIAAGSFTDTKDATLLAYYGLPTDVPYEGGFNISFSAVQLPNNGFTSTALYSGDLVNSPMNSTDVVNSPVPVPAAIWLLGSGLLGLVSSRGLVRENKKS